MREEVWTCLRRQGKVGEIAVCESCRRDCVSGSEFKKDFMQLVVFH